ncbi:ankyrin repeat-containing protein, partial [Reticulomyxa filosa]
NNGNYTQEMVAEAGAPVTIMTNGMQSNDGEGDKQPRNQDVPLTMDNGGRRDKKKMMRRQRYEIKDQVRKSMIAQSQQTLANVETVGFSGDVTEGSVIIRTTTPCTAIINPKTETSNPNINTNANSNANTIANINTNTNTNTNTNPNINNTLTINPTANVGLGIAGMGLPSTFVTTAPTVAINYGLMNTSQAPTTITTADLSYFGATLDNSSLKLQ